MIERKYHDQLAISSSIIINYLNKVKKCIDKPEKAINLINHSKDEIYYLASQFEVPKSEIDMTIALANGVPLDYLLKENGKGDNN